MPFILAGIQNSRKCISTADFFKLRYYIS